MFTFSFYDLLVFFLDVDNDNRTDFRRFNQNKSHQIKIIGGFSERPPEFLTTIAMKAKKILGFERLYLLDAIRSLNNKVAVRKTLGKDMRQELISEFETDIKKLAQLLDRDLSHWLTVNH